MLEVLHAADRTLLAAVLVPLARLAADEAGARSMLALGGAPLLLTVLGRGGGGPAALTLAADALGALAAGAPSSLVQQGAAPVLASALDSVLPPRDAPEAGTAHAVVAALAALARDDVGVAAVCRADGCCLLGRLLAATLASPPPVSLDELQQLQAQALLVLRLVYRLDRFRKPVKHFFPARLMEAFVAAAPELPALAAVAVRLPELPPADVDLLHRKVADTAIAHEPTQFIREYATTRRKERK